MKSVLLRNLFKHIIFTVVISAIPLSYGQQTQSHDVRIGVLAKRGEQTALVKWQATADYLNQQVEGYHFRVVPLTFDEIPAVVRNGLIDLVIVNPAIYADLTVKYDIRRILTLVNKVSNDQGTSSFGSVVFTRQDQKSETSWNYLLNKHWAAVHETSLGGWIFIQYELEKEGLPVPHTTFSGTHDQVVADVLNGRADVGIVRTDTLERMAKEDKLSFEQIKVIHPVEHENFPLRISSDLAPEWPISALNHVPDPLIKEVASALLAMKSDDPAAQAASINGWNIPESYQVVHDILKTLRLPPYDQGTQQQLLMLLKDYWHWLVAILALLGLQLGLMFHSVNLNKRLRQQQSLMRQSEEQFRSLFQQAAVGFAYTSPTGQIQKANHRLQTLSNRSEVELQRLNISDLIHSDDLSAANAKFEAIRRNEISQFSIQTRISPTIGLMNDCWVLFTLSVVRNPMGEITDLIGIFDDITQIKQLEQRLHTEQHLKSLILNIAGDGILGLDKQGRHTFVNPTAARLLGYEQEELLGKDSHSCWHHTRRDGSVFPAHECPITSVLQDGIVHRGTDEIFWRKDGSSFATEYISTPMRDGEEEIVGAVLIFREQTVAEHGADVARLL